MRKKLSCKIWVHRVIFIQCINYEVLQLPIKCIHVKHQLNYQHVCQYLILRCTVYYPNTDKTWVINLCFCVTLNTRLSTNELNPSWSSHCSLCHVPNLPITVEYGYIPLLGVIMIWRIELLTLSRPWAGSQEEHGCILLRTIYFK